MGKSTINGHVPEVTFRAGKQPRIHPYRFGTPQPMISIGDKPDSTTPKDDQSNIIYQPNDPDIRNPANDGQTSSKYT